MDLSNLLWLRAIFSFVLFSLTLSLACLWSLEVMVLIYYLIYRIVARHLPIKGLVTSKSLRF